MKRLFGVLCILIGLCGLAGSIAALLGVIPIPQNIRRGPIGGVFMSCLFLYVGYTWVRGEVAH